MKKTLILAVMILLTGGFASFASASHSWSKYHWDISTVQSEVDPLVFSDNLTTADWKNSLLIASDDWNLSVLKNQVVQSSNPNCDPVLGQVEICNNEYGNNGWLGIAQVWAYRGKDGHIAQALVKMNDTYFNTADYSTSAWRNMVVCQEVGHTLGLDHQDENFDNPNLGTCMDYTSDPTTNQHPNQHDYDQLEAIYGHLNGVEEPKGNKGGGGGKGKKPADVGADIDLDNPANWGQVIREDASGKPSLYAQRLNNGYEVFTFVTWVQ